MAFVSAQSSQGAIHDEDERMGKASVQQENGKKTEAASFFRPKSIMSNFSSFKNSFKASSTNNNTTSTKEKKEISGERGGEEEGEVEDERTGSQQPSLKLKLKNKGGAGAAGAGRESEKEKEIMQKRYWNDRDRENEIQRDQRSGESELN